MSSEKQLKYWLSLKGKPRTKRGSIQPCFICKEDFYVYPYQKEVSKFCSRKCQLVDRKGKPRAGNPANWKHTEVVKLKMSETRLRLIKENSPKIKIFQSGKENRGHHRDSVAADPDLRPGPISNEFPAKGFDV